MCSAMAFALMEEGEKNVMDGFGQASRIFGEIDIDTIVETFRSGFPHGAFHEDKRAHVFVQIVRRK